MIRCSHLVHKTAHKFLLYFGSIMPLGISITILSAKGIGYVIFSLCFFAFLLIFSFVKIK